MEKLRTYGAEIEKPTSNLKTGQPYRVGDKFFNRLAEMAIKRGGSIEFDLANGTIIGVRSDMGEQGLDNGFNLLETSFNYQDNLFQLQRLMELDLNTIVEALKEEDASVINLSIQPLGRRDLATYRSFVVPKGIYLYLFYRGWDHTAGIDARAQNSPTTSVNVNEAADALSVIIGAGAAFIGIFANSPFEEGRRSKNKESRLTMWERMMRYSKTEGDRITARFPPKRFERLAEYFNWMFCGKTSIHFVIASGEGKEYKNVGDRILIISGNPSVLEYLSHDSWQAFYLKDLFTGFPPDIIEIKPDISHMEAMQFAQFTGARLRYILKHEGFPLRDFVDACRNLNEEMVVRIFEEYATSLWIEGRDPGANFPDRQIWEAGDEIARSVVISPSAIQAGLIRNLQEALEFIEKYKWQFLGALRQAAIKDGLQGEVDGVSVYNFADAILEIAAKGLNPEEQKMLEYPRWVLATGKNGADRAIEFVEEYNGNMADALKELVISRQVIP